MSVRGKGVSISPQTVARFVALFRLNSARYTIGASLIFGFEIPCFYILALLFSLRGFRIFLFVP